MKISVIITTLILSGCAVVTPVKQKFPEVPAKMLNACPDLKLVEPTEKLSEVLKFISKNYSQYHECQITVDTWIEWYILQKQNFNK